MPKIGSYVAVSHAEFRLTPILNDGVGVDNGSGGGEIGANVAGQLKCISFVLLRPRSPGMLF